VHDLNTATDEPEEVGTGRRRRRRWPVFVGVIVGAAAVSGALVAQLRKSDEPPAPTSWGYTWPAEVSGQVWITVDAEDAATRTVTIRWGPWERPILHTTADPMTYVFTKDPTPPGEDPVPITVDVVPGATVEFGNGPPPTPNEDVNADWIEARP
jgi:hypothetical protein